MDGLALHRQYGRTYSCWPVILTPYNLPLGMCMCAEYMFVLMVIPDPSNPNVSSMLTLKSLIEELQNQRHVGLLTCNTEKRDILNAHRVDVDCE
ncbi:UNVERIFIED_CONTAM: hypothetical protein Sindi_1825800 [Sesamum indicum]